MKFSDVHYLPAPLRNAIPVIFFLFISSLSSAQMTPTYEVSIPMRDGKFLAADVYVPSSCTSCPAILIQTPYNKNLFRFNLPLGVQQNPDASSYAWVVVDWRGFYGSFSAAIAQPKRGEDGYDVIEWITEQSWSDGNVGTWGPSALGGVQYATAREKHPAHICAVPLVAHPQQAYDVYYYGGVLEKARLETLDMLGYGLSAFVLPNPYYNLTWQITEAATWYPADITIPTLQTGGWYDHAIDKMMDWYKATRNSAAFAVRDKQWLLVGPWVHGGTGAAYVGSATQGGLSYNNAAFVSDSLALKFFEYYLLNADNGWLSQPKITYYETGKNIWNSSEANSIEILNTDELFLNENGQLSGAHGSGYTSFTADPRSPSPTIGGATLHLDLDQGPYDQSLLEGRSDVITFSTAVLPSDISVSGRVKLNLYVECDQPDADIAVRLVDGYPDGRNMLINDGIRRMRFRNGYSQANETFMTPGEVYNVEVKLPFVNYTWKTGHALKIYISANSAIRWDVNLQNGGTMYAAGDTNTANIRIHHSSAYPAKILLPGNNPVLSAQKTSSSDAVHIFPNPAKDVIFIEADVLFDRYEIFDLYGRCVESKTSSENLLDVSGLKSGCYYFIFYSKEKSFGRKLVKE